MTVWRSWQIVVACTLLSSCSNPGRELAPEVASLKTRVDLLEQQLAEAKKRESDLDARITVSERNMDTLFARPIQQEPAESWVAWAKIVPLQPGGFGRSIPSPEGAYASKAACEENIGQHVQKNGGEPGSLTFATTDAFGRPAAKVYSCLPKGVDPRG